MAGRFQGGLHFQAPEAVRLRGEQFLAVAAAIERVGLDEGAGGRHAPGRVGVLGCLLYTSDAAD
ncbi:MAG: hypothetical protein QUT27_06885, partial [candidate division Zixibacteria bacterium]|nr:hypothetical protein [candidate division Zixibacteria bacterium]